MARLPNIKTIKLIEAQHAITPAIGSAVSLCKMLTIAELNAPMPNWIAPIKAEAEPAFLVKGAIDNAEEFGKVNPWQLKKIKMRNTVAYKPAKW